MTDGQTPLRLPLKVSPGAARTAIAGWRGERLKISVTAAPEKGKANDAVCRLLARALGIKPRQLRLVAGHGASEKLVEIDASADCLARLPPRETP